MLKFASNATRMGTDHQRFEERIYNWRDIKEYEFALGDWTISGKRMELRGLVLIARQMSCNAHHTTVFETWVQSGN